MRLPRAKFGLNTLLAVVASFAALFWAWPIWQRHRGAQQLVDAISSSSFADFNKAAEGISDRLEFVSEMDGGSTAVPRLARLLEEEDAEVRGRAAYALAALGPDAKPALPALIKALEKPGHVFWAVPKSNKPALPARTNALQDEDSVHRMTGGKGVTHHGRLVQWIVASAIAAIGPEAVSSVIPALSHKDAYVRKLSAAALGQIGPPARSAIPALIAAMRDKSDVVRWEAGKALWRIGPDALQPLIDLLAAANAQGRREAIEALRRFGPQAEAAIPALVSCLKDDDTNVRKYAAVSLGSIGPKAATAIPELIDLVTGDPDEEARFWAACAVVETGVAGVEALIQLLEDPTTEHGVRLDAMHALGEVGPDAKAAIPVLRKALSEDDPDIQNYAVSAIIRIDKMEIPEGDAREINTQEELIDYVRRRLGATSIQGSR